MTKIGAWCEVCKSRTHYTKDCWGPGTVCIRNEPEPIFRAAKMPIPTEPKTKLLRAIESAKEVEQ